MHYDYDSRHSFFLMVYHVGAQVKPVQPCCNAEINFIKSIHDDNNLVSCLEPSVKHPGQITSSYLNIRFRLEHFLLWKSENVSKSCYNLAPR